MSKKLVLAAAAVAILAIAGYFWFATQEQVPALAVAQEAPAADDGEATQGAEAVPDVIEMTLGNPDAPVTVVEYASFTCPHCANFHNNSFDQFKADFIDTDKINFVYREVYFDKFGLWAGMLARCQGPVKYFGIVDMLYERRDDWILSSDAEIAEGLRRLGRIAGMNDETLNVCLNDGEKAKALVAAYQKNAEADGVRSTPSFVINGENVGNPGYEGLTDLIEQELGG